MEIELSITFLSIDVRNYGYDKRERPETLVWVSKTNISGAYALRIDFIRKGGNPWIQKMCVL
jgi:hypothetical protein